MSQQALLHAGDTAQKKGYILQQPIARLVAEQLVDHAQ